MNPIKPIISDSSCIVWELQAGKPNPHEVCLPGVDQRSRVTQSASKGLFCLYYAMNRLRVRVGKQPTPGFELLREQEKQISQARKTLNASRQKHPFCISSLMTQEIKESLETLTKEKVYIALNSNSAICRLNEEASRPVLGSFFEEFLKSSGFKNMHEFLLHRCHAQEEEVFSKIFKDLKVDPKEELTSLMPAKGKYEDLNATERRKGFETLIRHEAVKAYGLSYASWSPTDSPKDLVKTLRESGPIYVGGLLGRCMYKEAPFKVETLQGGVEVYGWKKNAVRREESTGHAIVVVGAKVVSDKAYVYFMDPSDKSDPGKDRASKVYVISFANFKKHISNLNGQKMPSQGPFALKGKFFKVESKEPCYQLVKKGGEGVFFFPADLPKTLSSSSKRLFEWTPSQEGASLAKKLECSGPVLVTGALGPKAYLDPAIEVVDDFAGQKVWAWKVGAKRVENATVSHKVFIIGVKILGDKVQVFLMDADDFSSKKVYKISLDNLKKHVLFEGSGSMGTLS